jgi:hypothetical protein
MATDPRGERLQIMLTGKELIALDDWRFSRRMPTRAAAVRELLRLGLSVEGYDVSDGQTKSRDYGVVAESVKDAAGPLKANGARAARPKGGRGPGATA